MMIRNLNLTILEGARGRRGRRTGRRVLLPSGDVATLGNPDGPELILDPDNPDGPELILDPDNPDGPELILDPDNPDGPELILDPDNPDGPELILDPDNPDGLVALLSGAASPYGHAHAQGCCCGDGASDEPVLRAGVRPSDYSGHVIVRTADGVDDAVAESLQQLADELGLDGLKSVLELEAVEPTAPPGVASAAFRHHGGGADGPGGGGEADGEPGDAAGHPQWSPDHGPRADGPVVSFPAVTLLGHDHAETVATLKRLEALATRQRGFRPLSGLSSYWRVLAPEGSVGELVERLNALPEIDLAYRELAAGDPLSDDQNYLEDAPVGIGLRAFLARAEAAAEASEKESGETGADEHVVKLCDLEQQWRLEHHDFEAKQGKGELGFLFGANRDDATEEDGYGHHGNAVLGQLIGQGRIEGAVTDISRCVLASHYWSRELKDDSGEPSPFAGSNGHVAAAILNSLAEPFRLAAAAKEEETTDDSLSTAVQVALTQQIGQLYGLAEQRLDAGDVLLLEVERGGYPTEVDPLDFEAIRLASALGVHVIEAAGNGGHDLDAYVDPDTGRGLRRGSTAFRDSGAILVGAAYGSLPHNRAAFSNHGTRLDCFAWGTGVTTCGYGDLAGSERGDLYTNSFNGTSSAAPVIAAAAVLVQWYHCGEADRPIGVAEMRRLLSDPANGTRQGRGVAGHVGVMPDLHRLLRHRLALVPDVYLRRHPGDDGSRPGRDESISSSPDLVVTAAGFDPAQAQAEYSEGPTCDQPAPGEMVDVGASCSLLVRARNRGLGDGEVEVHTFCCPATTLITPELWKPVSTVNAGVPAGDLLHVEVASTNVDPPAAVDGAEPAPLSFLAVAVPVAKSGYHPAADYLKPAEQVLPPGGAYFDWRRYRHFLRSPGVAWRNVHRVAVKADAKLVTLPFYIAGTPDMTRRFDLEVVQRLPAGAKLSVVLHRDAAAKLLQRQASLQLADPSPVPPVPPNHERLILPRRPRLPVERLALDAGSLVGVKFELTGTPPETGHSLAIRQLWRGVEVGRITWCFETV